jgi:regulator of replication initiation timing
MEMEILNKILDKLEQVDNRIDSLTDKVDHGLNSLRGEMNEKFDKVNVQLVHLQETVDRIETSQQEDVISLLKNIDTKLEDTAKKSDIDGLKGDIEFIVKENSLFTLELDRLKRNA